MEILNRSQTNPVHKKMHELWRMMMGQCYNTNASNYHNYGARGVRVCEKWQTYDGFIDDVDKIEGFDLPLLLQKYKLQLDKDIKGNGMLYSLENCKFVTIQENSSNRRSNRKFFAIDLENEKVYMDNNRYQFAIAHDLDDYSIWHILKFNSGKPTSKKLQLYKGWTFFWIEDFAMEKLPILNQYTITNNENGKSIKACSPYTAAVFAGVNIQKVCRQMKKGKPEFDINDFSFNFELNKVIDYKDSTTIERLINDLSKQVE